MSRLPLSVTTVKRVADFRTRRVMRAVTLIKPARRACAAIPAMSSCSGEPAPIVNSTRPSSRSSAPRLAIAIPSRS